MSLENNTIKSQNLVRPYLIGIAGGSGSGKTSVASELFKTIGINNCLLFSMDTYYKNLTEEQLAHVNEYNFDAPEALDLDLLSYHLSELMNWHPIDMPTYNFAENKRGVETVKIYPNKLIIFEGILAFFDKRMRDMMDLKIFVDLDGDIRLSRRVYRDIVDRGRQMESVLERYHKFVKPAFEDYIEPTRKFADLVIPRGGSNTLAIDLLSQFMKSEMSHKLGGIIDENKEKEEEKIKKREYYEKLFLKIKNKMNVKSKEI